MTMKARWRIAAAIFVVVVSLAVIYSLLAHKQYIATAAVVVDIGADPLAGAVNPNQQLPSYLATQLDVVSSDRVAQRVVELQGLEQDPLERAKWQKSTHGRGSLKDWLARGLLESLVVTPSRESNVINIAFRASDPKQAAAFANAFAQAYIDINIQLKVQPAQKYSEWFADRVKGLRAELEEKQRVLFEFQQQNAIVPTDDRVNIENARLSELSTQLSTTQGQSRDAQARLREIAGNPDALPEVLQSSVIVNLKAQLSAEQMKSDDMQTQLGTNNPVYQRQSDVISQLHERIAQETARIVKSLAGSAQTNQRREAEARAALEGQKQRVIELKRGQNQESLLENDVIEAQKNLEAVSQRLAQTSLESQTKQSNIVLLSAAIEPLHPSSPNIRLNIAVAMFLGALLAIAVSLGLEFWQDRIREGDELPQLLGVPLLGTLSAEPYRRRIGLETI
jgi:chain length determinant protein EpsF